jgi:tetrahydromethanopterin S-methyltransferase subunit G
MSKVTLSMVYEEIKKINKRMDFIEELVEEVVTKELPKAKLTEEEVAEIKKSLEEMKKGECVTLDELMNV